MSSVKVYTVQYKTEDTAASPDEELMLDIYGQASESGRTIVYIQSVIQLLLQLRKSHLLW